MGKAGYIYIMTNKNKTALYIGVTNDLCRRIYEHKNHLIKNSFTDRYNLEYCIYFEEFAYFNLAIHREKELKKWNRQKKEDLINKKNPQWNVLVTEHGFIRDSVSFSRQVTDIFNELQQSVEIFPFGLNDKAVNEQIPPFGRNDDAQCGSAGGREGGEAVLSSSSFPSETNCHFERSEKTQTKKGNKK